MTVDQGSHPQSKPMIALVMGVCGCGKTTTGELLAERLGWSYLEGDDFHPEANVKKMAGGVPLTDHDRRPWLCAMNEELRRHYRDNEPVVLACSALKEGYRKLLLDGVSAQSCIIHLRGSREVISSRLGSRKGHFMPPGLLESQLETLEDPSDAIEVNVELDPAEQVAVIVEVLINEYQVRVGHL